MMKYRPQDEVMRKIRKASLVPVSLRMIEEELRPIPAWFPPFASSI
jgi:hypothetical protein